MIDPFANAFNYEPNWNYHNYDNTTKIENGKLVDAMQAWIYERKVLQL